MKGWTEELGDERTATRLLGAMLQFDGDGLGANGESFRLLSEALEAGVDAMLVLRAVLNDRDDVVDFQIVELNGKGATLLGSTRDAALGHLLGDLAPAAREEGLIRRYAAVMADERPEEFEFYAAPGGLRQIWMRQRIVPISQGVAVFASDVSVSRRIADASDRARRILERIAASTPDVLALWDVETRRFVYSNKNLHEVIGNDSGKDSFVTLVAMERFLHEDDTDRFRDHIETLTQSSGDDVLEETFRFRTSAGGSKWLRFRDCVFDRNADESVKTLMLTAQDVTRQRTYESELEDRMTELRRAREELERRQTELEELNQRLGNLAHTDSLTGLRNHRAFSERLAEEVERAQRYNQKLALVLADMDDFKSYNDRYGHPYGDEILRGFAQVLIDVSRSSDTVVRYGGEEFGLLLPNTSAEEAVSLAERIRASLRATEYGSRGVTASFGCAEVRAGRDAGERIVEEADRALYLSKRAGKDRVSIAHSEEGNGLGPKTEDAGLRTQDTKPEGQDSGPNEDTGLRTQDTGPEGSSVGEDAP